MNKQGRLFTALGAQTQYAEANEGASPWAKKILAKREDRKASVESKARAANSRRRLGRGAKSRPSASKCFGSVKAGDIQDIRHAHQIRGRRPQRPAWARNGQQEVNAERLETPCAAHGQLVLRKHAAGDRACVQKAMETHVVRAQIERMVMDIALDGPFASKKIGAIERARNNRADVEIFAKGVQCRINE